MQVATLGALVVRTGGGELLEVGGFRLRALLIMLALRPGQVVSASELIDGLWAGQAPNGAANALQALVSRLRRALPEARIESRPAGYQLTLDPRATDLVRFEELAVAGRAQLRRDPAGAAATLRQALALWRGPGPGRRGRDRVRPGDHRPARRAAAGRRRAARRRRPAGRRQGAAGGRARGAGGGVPAARDAGRPARRGPLSRAVRAPPGDPARGPIGMAADDTDALSRLLAALAGRQALLVLDNCEHLVAAAARLAGQVLAACPHVRILATYPGGRINGVDPASRADQDLQGVPDPPRKPDPPRYFPAQRTSGHPALTFPSDNTP